MKGNLQALKDRIINVEKKAKQMKFSNILEKFPVDVEPHQQDGKLRPRRKELYKKITFDSKLH